jgi:hypothetical protein
MTEHKEKFNLRGFFFPGQKTEIAPAPSPVTYDEVEDVEPSDDGTVDFGFDFLEEDDPLDSKSQEININQPFNADSETIPADSVDKASSDKPGKKGPEFAF